MEEEKRQREAAEEEKRKQEAMKAEKAKKVRGSKTAGKRKIVEDSDSDDMKIMDGALQIREGEKQT